MKRLIFLFPGLVVFLLFLSGQAFGATDPESLWNKAVEKRTAGEKLAPRILRLTQEELTAAGGIKSRETAVISLTYDATGKISLDVLSSVKDGQDFSAERRKRLASTVSRWADMKGDSTPFDREYQELLQRQPPKEEEDGGVVLLAYQFDLPIKEVHMTGKARVVEDSGAPYDVSYTLAPLPNFVDLMDLGLKFKAFPNGGYSAETVSYRFEASFLFFKWRGRGTLSFDDWTDLPVKPRLVK